MKPIIKTGLTLLAGSAFIGSATAQTSDLIDVTARVLKSSDVNVGLEGEAGDFGTILIPKSDGNICVYKIGGDGEGSISGSNGGANPEPGQCKFDAPPKAPKIKISGEPNGVVPIRITVQVSDEAKGAQLNLTFSDGTTEFNLIYPGQVLNEEGQAEFSPEITLTVPNTATEFDGGSVGTIIADVSY